MNPFTPPLRRLSLLALGSLAALSAQALDLKEAWQAARGHDPQVAVSQAAREAGAARRAQANALWQPAVQLSTTAALASADSAMGGAHFSAPGLGASDGVGFGTSVRGGTSTRWAVSARQPLLNPERQAKGRQLDLSADLADLAWQAAQQEVMLHTAQRYFDVTLAQRRLELLRQQQASVDKTLVEAKDRFALGDKPVTDIHEASARALALQAQVLAAQGELDLASALLADTTGLASIGTDLRAPGAGAAQPLALQPLAYWLAEAADHNLGVRMQQAAVQVAQQEVAKHQAASAATLDLVAQAGRDRLSGNGSFGAASTTASQQMVGLQLNLPLYTGGYRSARLSEALALEDKARAEVEATRQQVRQQTQTAWQGLQLGQARLQALEAAQTASAARLDATALGRQVGDRTTLELLQAQNDAASADLALVQARTDLLMNRLRLHALAGQLTETQLDAVNAQLAR